MAAPIPFDKDFDVEPGRCYELSPLLRRVTSPNPSLFTFKGTNTYIVGRGNVAVVDPGPDLPEQTAAILRAVEGETVTHIVVTHTHNDHSPGVPALVAATGAKTYGFGPHGTGVRRQWPFASPEGGDMSFRPDVTVPDGGTIAGDGWTLEALHTPGHISNHLCFTLKEENVLLSGDHVMAWSTSVVSPPDGDMADYMASLDRLLGRPETTYWPGHGPAVRLHRASQRAGGPDRRLPVRRAQDDPGDGPRHVCRRAGDAAPCRRPLGPGAHPPHGRRRPAGGGRWRAGAGCRLPERLSLPKPWRACKREHFRRFRGRDRAICRGRETCRSSRRSTISIRAGRRSCSAPT
jgi:glyoxylase-like metal-dependent hydrolase (beta-lactamase superfamily II)